MILLLYSIFDYIEGGDGMDTVKRAIAKLKEAGFKITERRVAMLEVLSNTDRHQTAKDVTQKLTPKFPGISPDTIYRNLHTFSELGILEETEFEGEKYFLKHCDMKEHHHHFICTNCGKSINIKMCPLNYFEDQLEDVEITDHRFEIFGLCADCKKQKLAKHG